MKADVRHTRRGVSSAVLLLLTIGLLVAGPARGEEDEYVIGADDLLHIVVWDNKDLEQQVVVRPDGKISFPLAGELKAAGLTVPQLTEALTERLAKLLKDPNVSVMVKEIRSFRVYFIGRVARPGSYPIKPGTPLLQALTVAGGYSEGADLPAAYVIRGDQKIPVDLRRLVQDGDLEKNIPLQSDDTVVVPEIVIGTNPQEMLERRIYMLGSFNRPGVYTLKSEVPILHALFLAGGVAPGGNMAAAFVVRDEQKIPVDLWSLLQKGDISQNLMIKHEDTIVIPSGGELQNAVYVMGEVNKPGLYPQPETLTILKLITVAGGFTRLAAPARASLIRQNGDKKVQMRINLNDILSDPAKYEDIPLKPGDVVVVPERWF